MLDAHIDPPRHADPFASFATQALLPLQKSPLTQSLSVAHDERQLVEPHTYGAHVVLLTGGQAPAPSQLAEAVAEPAVQLADRHDVVEPG